MTIGIIIIVVIAVISGHLCRVDHFRIGGLFVGNTMMPRSSR